LFIEGISSNKQTEVQIRNTSGVLFIKENLKENEAIDISILPQGIYFIKIFEGVYKFVKM
jgi:Secretion system C-terminal sorting domain